MSTLDVTGHGAGRHRGASAGMILRDGTLLVSRTEPGELSGERRLLIAVLEEAIWAYRGRGVACQGNVQRTRAKVRREAEAWFDSNAVGSPFAFVRICDELGLDPGAVRKALADWRAAQIREMAA